MANISYNKATLGWAGAHTVCNESWYMTSPLGIIYLSVALSFIKTESKGNFVLDESLVFGNSGHII